MKIKLREIGIVLAGLWLAFGPGYFTAAVAEETDSMMCDGGVVEIGNFFGSVEDKCGAPDTKQGNYWKYDFGPSEVYMVEFDENGKVVRILEAH